MAAFALGTTTRTLIAGMNITPLVDVMLVLLMIFMLAVPLKTHRLELESSRCVTNCPQPPALSIRQTGELARNADMRKTSLEPVNR